MIRHSELTCERLRWVASITAILVLGLCLSSAGPAMADHGSCPGPAPTPRICGQASISDPIPVVVPQILALELNRGSSAWLLWRPVHRPVLEFQADPSAPRAPPLSLV